MLSYSMLPAPLLALLFALPVFSAPVTPYDQFHDIAIQATKQPGPPICCLRPLPPLEPTEEEVLLSFEEWKAKRIVEASEASGAGSTPGASNGHKPGNARTADADAEPAVIPAPGAASAQPLHWQEITDGSAAEGQLPPHFRIPLNDRFNYASMDCSAQVHTSHRSAKSASSILASKKDRYMLSPCAEQKQYVIVELCEDIRIDTVQLANFEFFSGVFKDFTVSVAKRYTTDPAAWTAVGTYRAKNIRGVQSFHPPTPLGDFYRFIRIDFLSHYGNEYYCPLSLLRVYGLTHLEEWKWDMWEAESRARRAAEDFILAPAEIMSPPASALPVPVAGVSQANKSTDSPSTSSEGYPLNKGPTSLPAPSSECVTPVALTTLHSQADLWTSSGNASSDLPISTAPPESVAKSLPPTLAASSEEPTSTVAPGAHITGTPDNQPSPQSPIDSKHMDHSIQATGDKPRSQAPDSLYNNHSVSQAIPSDPVLLLPSSSSSASLSSQHSSQISSSHVPSSNSPPVTNHSSHTPRSAPASAVVTSHASSSHSHLPTIVSHPLPPVTTGGESIYRTIMNRLTALEANTTLYARYVEEQTAGVREMLRRLGEDVGRLDGIGQAQAQMYQRTIAQFERQQRRIEKEHSELLVRVNHLVDEVVLEKRLGIAQLCLLLAVLVAMALTRGSRGEPISNPSRSRTSSMREWGRRTFSGDWKNLLKSPNRNSASISSQEAQPIKVIPDIKLQETPAPAATIADGFPRSKRSHPITSGRKVGISARPRTPSSRTPHSRHHATHHHPGTPTGAPVLSGLSRPSLQRANSGSQITQSISWGDSPAPKSAKRWARSAHLHEVKGIRHARHLDGAESIKIQNEGDVFGPKVLSTEGAREPERRRPGPSVPLSAYGDLPLGCARSAPASETDASEGDAWVDTDLDGTDSDGGLPARDDETVRLKWG